MPPPSPRPRTRPLFQALALLLLSLPLLWLGLCSPLDVTDDPSRNGGYTRNAIYITRIPTALSDGVLSPAPQPIRIYGGPYTLIPAGTHLRLVRVSYSRMRTVGNIPHNTPYAILLDGPMPNTPVDLRRISARTPTNPPMFQFDPANLQRTPAP